MPPRIHRRPNPRSQRPQCSSGFVHHSPDTATCACAEAANRAMARTASGLETGFTKGLRVSLLDVLLDPRIHLSDLDQALFGPFDPVPVHKLGHQTRGTRTLACSFHTDVNATLFAHTVGADAAVRGSNPGCSRLFRQRAHRSLPQEAFTKRSTHASVRAICFAHALFRQIELALPDRPISLPTVEIRVAAAGNPDPYRDPLFSRSNGFEIVGQSRLSAKKRLQWQWKVTRQAQEGVEAEGPEAGPAWRAGHEPRRCPASTAFARIAASEPVSVTRRLAGAFPAHTIGSLDRVTHRRGQTR